MATNEQSRNANPWYRLQPRFKLLVSSPVWVGIAAMALLLYPEGIFLGAWLGISATEPVINNPNGERFMLLFCLGFVLTLFAAMATTYALVIVWLVKVSGHSFAEARIAMSWRSYPTSWLKN